MVPILLAGAALGSAGAGIAKLFDASKKKSDAKHMVSDAMNLAEYVARDSFRQGKKTNQSLSELIDLRKLCVTELMTRYVKTYKEIKEITYKKPNFADVKIKTEAYNQKTIEDISIDTTAFVTNSLVSTSAGAAAAYGVYGIATSIGLASTGTAISTLSGAAATNATLAWLGGGSLSAGGMGMAGGTAVLGGVVAGPAILVMGLLAAKKAEEHLTNAIKQEADIRLGIEQIRDGITMAKAIEARTKEMHIVTYKVADLFINHLCVTEDIVSRKKLQVKNLIESAEIKYKNQNVFVRFIKWITGKSPKFSDYKSGNTPVPHKFYQLIFDGIDPLNYNNFTESEKNIFQIFLVMGVNLHQLLKTSIIGEDGQITQDSETAIKYASGLLEDAA